MSEMSLEEQIRRMEEMKDYLGDFCTIMQQEVDQLRQDIDFLRSQGLPTETEESYTQRYYNPAKNNIEEVINSIYTRHYSYIDDVISDLERAKNR